MKRLALALALWLLPTPAVGQVSPENFARGAELRVEGGSIFRVVLPDDVYETVTRPDIGDIRVLNADGDVVPHALRMPSPGAAAEAWHTVPSFPMPDLRPGVSGRTQVRLDANGAVLEVTRGTPRQATTAYLVDLTAVDVPVARLELSWTAPDDLTFLARVDVQASNDLSTWRTIVSSAALARLERGDLALTQNEIELPQSDMRYRYLRISWPRELSAVALTDVRVQERSAGAQPETRWRTVTADHVEGTGTVVYDAGGLFPVEHVDLEFAGANVVSVVVRSRPSPSADWEQRYGGLFYSLQETDGNIRNAPARIGRTADRFWSIERAGGGAWTAAQAPRLKLGWHPHELVFVAQGTAPFTLVYGSARVEAADAPLDAPLRQLEEAVRGREVRTATLGAPRTLGGADALRPPLPLRRAVLWTVLVAAVALLAWLAVRTVRDTV